MMIITVKLQNEKDEKVLRAFLDSLEYEYIEGEDLYISASPGTRRQTIEAYNQELGKAVAEVESGNYYTHEEVKKMMEKW